MNFLQAIVRFLSKYLGFTAPPVIIVFWFIWVAFCLPILGVFSEKVIDSYCSDWSLVATFGVPILSFIGLVWFTSVSVRRVGISTAYRLPEPRKALIMAASWINIDKSEIQNLLVKLSQGHSALQMFQAIHADPNLKTTSLLLWLRAIEWHRNSLKHCYVLVPNDLYLKKTEFGLVSDQTKSDVFEQFMREYGRLRNVEVEFLRPSSGYDVEAVRQQVEIAISCCRAQKIKASEIMVDITTGTSAISAAAILAAIAAECPVQYFPQYREGKPEFPSIKEKGLNRPAHQRVASDPTELAWGKLPIEESKEYPVELAGGLLPIELDYDIEAISQAMDRIRSKI